MLLAFQSLGISLQAIPHLMKESGHLAIADAISLPLQLLSQIASTLRTPAQERLRVPSGQRFHELLQSFEQIWLMKGERLTASPCSSDSSRYRGFVFTCFQFADAGMDRTPR